MEKNFTALVCLGLTAVPPAIARETESKAKDQAKPNTATGARDAAAAKAFEAAIRNMDLAMKAAPYSGNADVDFVTKMIPHHQGAVNMAKAELAYSNDPKIRRLAEIIIRSQSHQIVEMDAWLATQRVAPANYAEMPSDPRLSAGKH